MEGASHPHYAHYDPKLVRRLDGFYGLVDETFNGRVASHVVGPRVLDFGCGFGSLVDHLRRHGFEATGIDLLASAVAAGRQRFPKADLRLVGPGPLTFGADAFDTIVFKESLHHLAAESGDIEAELAAVRRVCSRRIVIFEPNPSLPLKVGRTLIGHVDPTLQPDAARLLVEAAGFEVTVLQYHASLALPLSGGYVGRPVLSRRTPHGIIRLDDMLVRWFGAALAWRYLMVADKISPNTGAVSR